MHPPHLPAPGKEVNSDFRQGFRYGGRAAARMQGMHSRFYLSNGGATVISKVEHELNEEIRDKEIRLIGENGEQLGIVSSAEGLHIAEEKGLDLVKISPGYAACVQAHELRQVPGSSAARREKEARKNQHVVEIKEIRMSPGIDVGDFNTKLKNAQKFLADGNRVKVSVRFRGREMAHTDIGRDLLKKFAELLRRRGHHG